MIAIHYCYQGINKISKNKKIKKLDLLFMV